MLELFAFNILHLDLGAIMNQKKGQRPLVIDIFLHAHCWNGRQLLNASNARACYFPHQAVLHVATCSSSVPGSCPGVRQSCEAMVNIMRNVWRLWEGMYLPRVKRKFRTWSSLGELKKHKQNMCLHYLFCSCTIALLEEQDVLQDCFSLSFAL